MPKTCPKPRPTPCDGAWPYEKDDCCYKRLPKSTHGQTSRTAPARASTSTAAPKRRTKTSTKRTTSSTVAELRAQAKAFGMRGYSKLKKDQLVRALESYRTKKTKAGKSTTAPKRDATTTTRKRATPSPSPQPKPSAPVRKHTMPPSPYEPTEKTPPGYKPNPGRLQRIKDKEYEDAERNLTPPPPEPEAPMLRPLTYKPPSPKSVPSLASWESNLVTWLRNGNRRWELFPRGTEIVIEPSLVKFVAEKVTRNAELIGRNARSIPDLYANIMEFRKGAHIRDPIHKRLYLDFARGTYDWESEMQSIMSNAYSLATTHRMTLVDWEGVGVSDDMVQFAKDCLAPNSDVQVIRYMVGIIFGMATFIRDALKLKKGANGEPVMVPISERTLRGIAEKEWEELLLVFY